MHKSATHGRGSVSPFRPKVKRLRAGVQPNPEPDPSTGASPMHELARKSIPPTPPPSSPPDLAVSPPVIDPERFEDFMTFRETFCVYFPDAIANARLRGFGHLLFEMVLETWGQWPNHPEGIFPNELRAAVADMRHLQGAMSSWCGP